MVGVVAIVKWTVIGTYRPRVEPLWSRFVRRSELVTGLYEAAAVPALLYLLMGTPMLPPMLRLFGAQDRPSDVDRHHLPDRVRPGRDRRRRHGRPRTCPCRPTCSRIG